MSAETARTDASASPSPPTAQPGSATIAAGKAASAVLTPLTDRHFAAIEARGLDPELLVKHGVGASRRLDGDCIGIPYFENGVRVGTKYRTLTGEKRFTQDVGSRQILWNVDCLRDDTLADHPLIVCEGEMDAFAAMQAGFPRVVSVPGGAPKERVEDRDGKKYAFLDEAKQLLDGCREIILATDGDGSGFNLRDDLALRLGAHRCRYLGYPQGCKDLNDSLRLYGVKGVVKTISRAKLMQIRGYFEMDELPPVEEPLAHDTGIVNLASHYKLRLGDFTVVTGIPGHGKSSFINEVTCRMAQRFGWRTVFASFEQTPQTDHRRALRTFYAERLEREMTPDQITAADVWIRRHFGFIVPGDDDDVTLEWMLETMAQAVLRKEAQIVVIDPWNEMDHTRAPDMSQSDYVGFAIKQFKKFAKKYRVHLIVAAHPAKMARGKDGKYPVPSLYDIADSAHWSNKPEVGIVIHRPDLSVNETLIRVVKARYQQIGTQGEIKGAWAGDRGRYTIADEPELL